MAEYKEKQFEGVREAGSDENGNDLDMGHISDNADQLQRRLNNRQIQLIAIGGSIGTALFVSIGGALNKGGPGSLFIAYVIYSCMLAFVNNCMAEMATAFPVSGGFIRMAGHWVDDAFGFMAGYNFFFYEALLIPFEITALNLVLTYWTEKIPVAAVCAIVIVLYALINMLAVRAYGEAEFWLSGGKVILIFMLFFFAFITMVGGNPRGDAYGFRYWNNPGSFAVYHGQGKKGQFEGFLACLWSASFTVVGPEYIAMVAAEAKRPRIYIKNAFKTVYIRFAIFFMGGALAVGIVCASNDKTLNKILTTGDGGGTAAASPYVIAMQNLGISVLPDITNALMMTSIFSAGNTYTYAATRTLYGLALEGRAPKFLRKCTKNGVPFYCFCVVMIFPFLSFLQVSSNSSKVLTWLVNLVTAGGIIDYIVMCVTYIRFHKATVVQGFDRNQLPYVGWFQPYSAWIGLCWMVLMVFTYGYSSFWGGFVTDSFFSYYTMLGVAPILFVFWKVVKRTKFKKAHEIDLVWERPIVDAYEASFTSPPVGFWTEMMQLVGLRRGKKDNYRRDGSISG